MEFVKKKHAVKAQMYLKKTVLIGNVMFCLICYKTIENVTSSMRMKPGYFLDVFPTKQTFKNEKCHGEKHSKERVTLLLATNMDGSEKIKLLLIGKSKNPRCVRGIKWLPVHYESNSKAWMTGFLFEKWLLKLDKKFEAENRKVLMLIDNCSAHPPDLQSKLKSIELKFFLPNATSKLQHLDQGIIKNLKCYYRRRILMKTISVFEKNQQISKLTLMDCVNVVSKAWDINVKSETITNCFKKAGFGKVSLWDEEDEIPLVFLKDNILNDDEELTRSEYEKWITLIGSSNAENYRDYLNVDDDIYTADFPTDEDIIETHISDNQQEDLNSDNSDSEETSNETIQVPTTSMALDALETLRLFMYSVENTPNDGTYRHCYKLLWNNVATNNIKA
nr:PREDICTED: tigger transposable element-derived protein 4 [Tribolium castaneum]|eukprot:XP_015838614.1 PREDICTED: tigger transposable element-derived protein 4 [Tribolium castaneum]